jgi:CRP-like cAMP-binding protein
MLRPFPEYAGGNTILDYLLSIVPNAEAHAASVMHFASGHILLDSNAALTDVYFPIDMMVSNTTLMRDGSEVEVGTVGREGVCGGTQLILGVNRVPGKAICQVAGRAARLPRTEFMRWMDDSRESRTSILQYVQASFCALEISVACNALHPVIERCARWLLVTHDRVRRDEFGLTQEFLSIMLGVRRATVNSVEQKLQELRCIRLERGIIHIVDRAALERASCECYRLTIDRFHELSKVRPLP